MLESYIRTGDGKDYVDVDCVREALGIKEDEDIFLAIKKLKEERGRYKSNCDYFAGIAEDKLCDRNKLELELREALGIVDEYADIPGLVRKLREERDQLKDRVRRLRIQANSIYGASCGYSGYTGDKAPAFRCNVISYSWEFEGGALHNGSICVELNLTPTANYKGTFDMEDLKRYIQNYGREKKLGVIESVDYQNAKVARAELEHLYKTVLGKEKRTVVDSLAELRAKVREIYRSVVDDEWDGHLSYTSAMNDINEEYKRVVHNFEERTADWHKTQQDLDRYKLAVGSLLDIPEEARDDINAIERSFYSTEKAYESLKEFRDSVCEILDIPSSMADNQIIKEIHDIADRYDELEDFRADICGVLDIEGTLTETIYKLKNRLDCNARFCSNICTALFLGCEMSNEDILERVRMIRERNDKLAKLNDQVTALEKAKEELQQMLVASQKQVKGWTNRCDSLGDQGRVLSELRKNAIEDLKSRGFCFRPEENETLPEIYDKLLKRYDWAYGMYEEQYRLRQCWHARYESENERANGEHKRAEKLKNDVKCWTERCDSLQTALNNSQNDGVALQAFRNECKKLREEKTKVITALGQDTWDDCLK